MPVPSRRQLSDECRWLYVKVLLVLHCLLIWPIVVTIGNHHILLKLVVRRGYVYNMWRVALVEQELLTFPKHLNSPWFLCFVLLQLKFSVQCCVFYVCLSFYFVGHGLVCLPTKRFLSAPLVSRIPFIKGLRLELPAWDVHILDVCLYI